MAIEELLTDKIKSDNEEIRENATAEICNNIINDELYNEDKVKIMKYCLQQGSSIVGKSEGYYFRGECLIIIDCILEDNYEKNYIDDVDIVDIYNLMLKYIEGEDFTLDLHRNELGVLFLGVCDIFNTLFKYPVINKINNFKSYFFLMASSFINTDGLFCYDEEARLLKILRTVDLSIADNEEIISFIIDAKDNCLKSNNRVNHMQNYYNLLLAMYYFATDYELKRHIKSEIERKYERYKYV